MLTFMLLVLLLMMIDVACVVMDVGDCVIDVYVDGDDVHDVCYFDVNVGDDVNGVGVVFNVDVGSELKCLFMLASLITIAMMILLLPSVLLFMLMSI